MSCCGISLPLLCWPPSFVRWPQDLTWAGGLRWKGCNRHHR